MLLFVIFTEILKNTINQNGGEVNAATVSTDASNYSREGSMSSPGDSAVTH